MGIVIGCIHYSLIAMTAKILTGVMATGNSAVACERFWQPFGVSWAWYHLIPIRLGAKATVGALGVDYGYYAGQFGHEDG